MILKENALIVEPKGQSGRKSVRGSVEVFSASQRRVDVFRVAEVFFASQRRVDVSASPDGGLSVTLRPQIGLAVEEAVYRRKVLFI